MTRLFIGINIFGHFGNTRVNILAKKPYFSPAQISGRFISSLFFSRKKMSIDHEFTIQERINNFKGKMAKILNIQYIEWLEKAKLHYNDKNFLFFGNYFFEEFLPFFGNMNLFPSPLAFGLNIYSWGIKFPWFIEEGAPASWHF